MKISWRILHTDVKQSHSTLVRFVILRQTPDSSEQLSNQTLRRYKLCKILVHVILISKTEMKLRITNSKRKARKNLVTWSASPFAVKTRTVVFRGSRRMRCVLGLCQASSFSWENQTLILGYDRLVVQTSNSSTESDQKAISIIFSRTRLNIVIISYI